MERAKIAAELGCLEGELSCLDKRAWKTSAGLEF